MSSAYHPQTDGQSERTNQTVETILRIFCNHQQDNWADWLKIAQYMINSRPSSTTKKPPYELWMGFIPRTHQPTRVGNVPAIEERKSQLLEARKRRPRSHQQGAIPLVKRPTLPKILRGSEGLARRNPSPYNTSDNQIKGQTLWTLQNYGSTQRRDVQTRPPTRVENPQCIPRGCPPPI